MGHDQVPQDPGHPSPPFPSLQLTAKGLRYPQPGRVASPARQELRTPFPPAVLSAHTPNPSIPHPHPHLIGSKIHVRILKPQVSGRESTRGWTRSVEGTCEGSDSWAAGWAMHRDICGDKRYRGGPTATCFSRQVSAGGGQRQGRFQATLPHPSPTPLGPHLCLCKR